MRSQKIRSNPCSSRSRVNACRPAGSQPISLRDLFADDVTRGDLVDALVQLGCPVRYLANAGYPPLRIGNGKPGSLATDGTGLMWGPRSPLLQTADAGHTWTTNPIADGDVRIVLSGSAVAGGTSRMSTGTGSAARETPPFGVSARRPRESLPE